MKFIFYDFFGYNIKLFSLINYYTNQSQYIAKILKYISILFNIDSFICYFFIANILYLTKILSLKKTTKPNEIKRKFDNYFYQISQANSLFFLFSITFFSLKKISHMPRPICTTENIKFISIAKDYAFNCFDSFPSAHIALGIMSLSFFWSYLTREIKIAYILLLIYLAISRITLAMHFPSDIIYSCFISLLIIYLHNNYIYKNNIKKYIVIPLSLFFYKKIFK